MDEQGDKVYLDLGLEQTEGRVPDEFTFPKLWEPLLLKNLQVGATAWEHEPLPPLTRRTKLRLWWNRQLAKWPLMWKSNCDCGEDW